MGREFRSAVGWWYYLTMAIVIAGCVYVCLQTDVVAIVATLLAAALVVHVYLNTWYRITEEGVLIAHCSIFPEKKIAIADIQALEPTMMPMSSYALSLDRIMIYVDNKPWIMVSPQNKNEFVKVLRSINPQIKIMKENTFI